MTSCSSARKESVKLPHKAMYSRPLISMFDNYSSSNCGLQSFSCILSKSYKGYCIPKPPQYDHVLFLYMVYYSDTVPARA